MSTSAERRLDPITFEVLANAFSAIVDDMGAMLEKVSFSTVTHLGKDYSCVLATPEGDVFARGKGGLCMISGTATSRIKAVIDLIGYDEIDAGDVFLINDPFLGGTHAQDVGAVMPVFADDKLVAFVMAASHWPDVGGPVPGSFNSAANSTYAESMLIPPIHIVREGRLDAEVERFIFRNARIPQILRGDLRGMIEACRTGHDQYVRLHEKYGGETVGLQQHAQMDHSERLMRKQLSELPDGTWSFTDWIDRDPAGGTDEPIPVGLDLTIDGDRIVADFTRTGGQAVGPTNASKWATVAAVATALKEIFHEVPWNEGLERPVELVFAPATVVSAEYPRPVSGVAASPAEKVLACVHGALGQVVPERTMACPTNLVNVSIDGHDGRPGRGGEYVMYVWMAGGWGARPGRKDHHTYLIPLGPGTNLQPCETLERVFPVRFDTFQLQTDSEGAGRHRGGFALQADWRMTHGDATVNIQGDRQRIPGWGVDGGQPSLGNDARLGGEGEGEESRRIDIMSAGNAIAEGELLAFSQGGGGGWERPETRPVEWVLEDVQSGLVTIGRAAGVYGVVIDDTGADVLDWTVDAAATATAREGLAAA